MKTRTLTSYPLLRREYADANEMADAINRGPGYIYQRMNGSRVFTYREKVKLLKHIGQEPSKENIEKYFPEE